jgi:hypothetical protein
LAAAQPEQEGNDFQDASRYLQGLLSRGWKPLLSESGGVQIAAQVLRAAAALKSFPFDAVSQGIELILDQRNSDDAWGERKGGNSNVEATSACLVALCAAGANRLINSKFALSAISEAGLALQETRRELDQIRGDIRNQVTRGTGRIVAENDRLNARVIELEKEKKILVSKIEESEDTILSFLEDASTRLDMTRGRESLRRSLGPWDSLRLTLRELSPYIALMVGTLGLLSALRALKPTLLKSLGVELPKYTDYFVISLLILFALPALIRAVTTVFRGVSSLKIGGLEVKVGDIGASDRKLVQRRLTTYMLEWSAGTRESFLHMLSRLPGLAPESRESAARSIARELALGGRQSEELSIILSLFSSLSEAEQKDVLYSLREVRGRVAAS